jgi:hypothetical protein
VDALCGVETAIVPLFPHLTWCHRVTTIQNTTEQNTGLACATNMRTSVDGGEGDYDEIQNTTDLELIPFKLDKCIQPDFR